MAKKKKAADQYPTADRKAEITSHEVKEWLRGKRIKLDCGHYYQVHPFSNTMIITADGKTCCHN